MMNTNARDIKFMDYCAGIGAGRLGLEKTGLTCVGFSEMDIYEYKKIN